jgi:large subunit ribosomal protein L9
LIEMKVLLLKDVHKLGRPGDVKRVADGFGRNFLLPQNLAVLATPGAMKQVDAIRTKANSRRNEMNKEMGGLADQIAGMTLYFGSKAGDTGKLYGSITAQMVADALSEKLPTKVDRRIVEIEPIRTLGEHKAHVRLTVDLTPELKIVVHREGEIPAGAVPVAKPVVVAEAEEAVPAEAEEQAE